MKRRTFLLAGAALSSPGIVMQTARAEDASYPTRPIKLVVQAAPGAITDQTARLYATRMERYLKQPVLVENVAGAGGLVAFRQVAAAHPDGYTLLAAVNTLVAQPHVTTKAGYTLKDFTPVGEMASSPSILVVAASSPFKTFDDLLEAARKAPGTLSYGSSGVGSTGHLNVEMLASSAKVKFLHVPYKSVAAAAPDVIGGRLTFVMPTTSSTAELIKSGALRPLAITSPSRAPAYPTVPTLTELGFPDSSFEIWCGLFAPANIPPSVLDRLAAAMKAAREDKELIKTFETLGQEILADVRTPGQFADVLRRDDTSLARIIKEANIVAD